MECWEDLATLHSHCVDPGNSVFYFYMKIYKAGGGAKRHCIASHSSGPEGKNKKKKGKKVPVVVNVRVVTLVLIHRSF